MFQLIYTNVFLGKFGPKIWSSPNWRKFGTGVLCYILISNLIFIFKNSEVLQINWNLVQGYVAMCLLRFKHLFFQKSFHLYFFLSKFGLKIRSSCTGMYCYMFIRILMFIFSKFLSVIFLLTNLVTKFKLQNFRFWEQICQKKFGKVNIKNFS